MKPDILKFNADLQDGRFLLGVQESRWDMVNNDNGRPDWPSVILWIAAASRSNSPDKFYFKLDLLNYPSQAPIICIWDNDKSAPLEASKRPKGVENVKMLFRSDWENGLHLYAPYERHALATHSDWPAQYPNLCWKSTDSILKVLEDIHFTLNSEDYHGT